MCSLLQVIEHFGYSMPAVCATPPNAALQSFQQQSLPIRAMTKQPGARDLARVANLDNLDLKSQMPLLGALKSPGPRTPTKSSPRERMASVEELDIGLYRLSLSNRRDNVLTPPSTPQDERVARGPLFEYCAHSEGSPLLKIPPNTPCTPYRNNIPNLKVSDLPNDPRPRLVPYMSPNREGSEAATVSVLAIDNKIEQAMDLVKTHLTFAVREEVEVLRATIVELENRLRNLEVENVVLRQILPSEVVTSLVASGSLDPTPPTTTVPDTIAVSNLATMIQAQQARQTQIARQENVPPKEPEF